MKKLRISLVFALAAVFLLTSLSFPEAKTNKEKNIDNCLYSILSKKTVQFEGTSKNVTSLSIPDTVQIEGIIYNVISIDADAMKGSTKLKTLTIGKNVSAIGKYAFYNCKKLDSITIKSENLTKSSVKSGAFKKISQAAVVNVPEQKYSEYKSLLKSRGITEKGQKIVSEKTGNGKVKAVYGNESFRESWENYDTSQPLPDPLNAAFSIGDFSKQNCAFTDEHKIVETAEYDFSKGVAFTSGIRLDPHLYGDWHKETFTDNVGYFDCAECRRTFNTEMMLAIHTPLMNCLSMRNYSKTTPEPFDAWVFQPDDTPCRVEYKYHLSDGLEFNRESLKVRAMNMCEIPSDKYHVQVDGNTVTIAIENIKSKPFYTQFDIASYKKAPFAYEKSDRHEAAITPINVLFYAGIRENTEITNTISASISYSYKGKEKTINLGTRKVHTAAMKINNTDNNGNELQGGTFSLYAEKLVSANSGYGSYEWEKIKSGLKSGDVIRGLGTGFYKIVQDNAPDGCSKNSMEYEFNVTILYDNGTATIMAKDSFGTNLALDNGIFSISIVNKD